MRFAPVLIPVLVMVLPGSLLAQSAESIPSVLVKEETRIWTSPLRLHTNDSRWLLPLAAGTAALIVTDHAVSNEVRESPLLQSRSHELSKLGSGLTLTAATAGLYGLGRLSHNSRLTTTALLAGDALVHSAIVSGGLKFAFNRERPNKPDGTGAFWEGGRSFPSGHATVSWAFATVVAHQYRDKPLIEIGAYSLATTVSLARVGGRNHYPSDVVIGAALGTLIGRFVLHQHDHH